jgi:esterase/lipase superfamily enzyme
MRLAPWWGVLLLLQFSSSVANAQDSIPQNAIVTLVGTVISTEGKPLEKASVVVRRRRVTIRETVTDGKGRFSIGPMEVRAAIHEVSASLQGFEPAALRIPVFPYLNNDVTNITLALWSSGPPASPTPNLATIKVFFATDREPLGSSQFGAGRHSSSQLTVGSMTVPIPRDHRVGRQIPASFASFERESRPREYFTIRARNVLKEQDFYDEINGALTSAGKKPQVLVFIHGYNVEFDEALLRTAQIASDLQFSGVPILYSWPSNGEFLSYVPDVNSNDWTVPHLAEFLRSLRSRLKPATTDIHIIAHSMGNRALVQALAQLQLPPPVRFGQLVLAAPDVDTGVFKQVAPAVRARVTRTTLYASSKDRALAFSKKVNGYPRAGDSTPPPPLIVSGVDSIDVSEVDTDFLGMRHDYIATNRTVLSDVFYLLTTGSDPDKRFGITAVGTPPTRYWIFRP